MYQLSPPIHSRNVGFLFYNPKDHHIHIIAIDPQGQGYDEAQVGGKCIVRLSKSPNRSHREQSSCIPIMMRLQSAAIRAIEGLQ